MDPKHIENSNMEDRELRDSVSAVSGMLRGLQARELAFHT